MFNVSLKAVKMFNLRVAGWWGRMMCSTCSNQWPCFCFLFNIGLHICSTGLRWKFGSVYVYHVYSIPNISCRVLVLREGGFRWANVTKNNTYWLECRPVEAYIGISRDWVSKVNCSCLIDRLFMLRSNTMSHVERTHSIGHVSCQCFVKILDQSPWHTSWALTKWRLWRLHVMETLSTFALCEENPLVIGGFSSQSASNV